LIGLERVGGVMVYDVTTPYAPKYVQYFNDRFIGQTGGDLGPEGLIFIPADQSPTSTPLLVSANELSKTVAVYGVNPTKAVAQQVGDTLLVEGTAGNDYLAINPAPGGNVEVKSGSQSLGVFSLAGLMQLKLYGYGGNDTLLVNPALSVNSFLSGGDGDDYLSTGGGHDILLGGNGRDRLLGRGGSDLLIGGDDADLLFGGLHNDIVIGGTTAYDHNQAALFEILNEFRNTGAAAQLSAATVFDDGDIDSVYGEAGLDWFFLNTSDRSDRGRDAGE
jgi:Ca2+-binding RTX toxin-like protein